MSMPFTRRLSLLFSGELSKILINLLTGNLDTFIDEANYGKLLETLESPSQKHPKSEILDSLVKNMGKGAEWSKALRTYMVLHKLIHKQGEEMVPAFSPEKMKKLNDVKLSKKIPLKKTDIQPLLPLYLEYLQQLALHYKEISVCFAENEHVEDLLMENHASLLEFLTKAQNILSVLLKMFPLIETFLATVKGTGLLKQATYYCLTDAHNLYTYISTIVDLMIKEIFNLPKEDATTLYQIYSEHIFMTKKLKTCFDLKNHLTDFYLAIPEFYQIDVALNTEIELYIVSIKRGQFAKREKNCSLGHPIIGHGSGSISPREEPEAYAKSLCEISQSVVKSISNLNTVEKKQFIQPPKFFARRQNMNALHGVPKIKVKKPANKFCDPEANIFLKKGNEANQNLLKVPDLVEEEVPCPGDEPEFEAEIFKPEPIERYTLQVTISSPKTRQMPNNINMNSFGLMVPQMNFYNQGSCRSLQNLTPTQSLGGSFAESISVENLSCRTYVEPLSEKRKNKTNKDKK